MRRIEPYLMLLLFVLAACRPEQSRERHQPYIIVSIPPQKYFVERIAGNLYPVHVMVPNGMGPETYEPTPGDLEKVARAPLYFLSGHLEFEPQLTEKLRDMNSSCRFVESGSRVEWISGACRHEGHEHAHGGIDPHYWMSPGEVKIVAETIHDAMIDLIPGQKTKLDSGLHAFLADIETLDGYLKKQFTEVKTRKFILFHPSLSYLARDYQLEQLALEYEGKPPSPARMKLLLDEAESAGIRTVFLQSQFDRNNMETLARALRGRVEKIDPLDPDWLNAFYSMAQKLGDAMNGK